MENHFEINVSLNGVHLFATAPRSIITKAQFDKVMAVLSVKFPESEGFNIISTYWACRGIPVDCVVC